MEINVKSKYYDWTQPYPESKKWMDVTLIIITSIVLVTLLIVLLISFLSLPHYIEFSSITNSSLDDTEIVSSYTLCQDTISQYLFTNVGTGLFEIFSNNSDQPNKVIELNGSPLFSACPYTSGEPPDGNIKIYVYKSTSTNADKSKGFFITTDANAPTQYDSYSTDTYLIYNQPSVEGIPLKPLYLAITSFTQDTTDGVFNFLYGITVNQPTNIVVAEREFFNTNLLLGYSREGILVPPTYELVQKDEENIH